MTPATCLIGQRRAAHSHCTRAKRAAAKTVLMTMPMWSPATCQDMGQASGREGRAVRGGNGSADAGEQRRRHRARRSRHHRHDPASQALADSAATVSASPDRCACATSRAAPSAKPPPARHLEILVPPLIPGAGISRRERRPQQRPHGQPVAGRESLPRSVSRSRSRNPREQNSAAVERQLSQHDAAAHGQRLDRDRTVPATATAPRGRSGIGGIAWVRRLAAAKPTASASRQAMVAPAIWRPQPSTTAAGSARPAKAGPIQGGRLGRGREEQHGPRRP